MAFKVNCTVAAKYYSKTLFLPLFNASVEYSTNIRIVDAFFLAPIVEIICTAGFNLCEVEATLYSS